MIGITPNSTHYRRFSASEPPDALPTATVYADNTSLGAATVATGPGVNDYRVTVAVPSNVTTGQEITVAINWTAGGTPQPTFWLWVGVVSEPYATASQATAIAADAAAAKSVSEAVRELLESLTELNESERRFTAEALSQIGLDLQPVLDAIANAEGVENEAIADAVAVRLSSMVLTVQSHTNNATGELTITRGDDYSGAAAIRVDIQSETDLSGLHLVIAAASEHGDTFAVRMPILGAAPEHYANFCPPGELTEQWPEGAWDLRHRIEHEPGKLRTVARSRMTVRTFATPAAIIDLD